MIGVMAACALPEAVAAQGSLEGTVTDAASQPVAGVNITLGDAGRGGLTADDGTYLISGIPAGSQTVRFTRIGYGTEEVEVAIADGEITRLDVTLAEAPIALDRLVVVGSRAHARTAAESMVPIDVVPVSDLASQGDTDLSTLLRNVVPSYNVTSEPISDAATIARPASIRNLAPDHTLVLVNGKRRHRSAVIVLFGGNGVADGAQAPDIATLPSIAMSQVEVLRDGASAQYGSDAIAGVINFVPKSNRSGGLIEVKGSRFQEGDGEMFTAAGNIGLPLGETGFLSLSGEYGQADPTSRSIQRDDAAFLASLGVPVRNPAQIWGLPEVDANTKLFANMGYTFANGVELYGHGNYHTKTVTGGFYFRNPNTRDAVFSIDGGQTLLIGDLLDARDGVVDGSANCPEVRVVSGVADPIAMTRVRSDPNCFSFQEMFPGGFTPNFGGDVFDASGVAGLRGTAGTLEWDASVGWGDAQGRLLHDEHHQRLARPRDPDRLPPRHQPAARTQPQPGPRIRDGRANPPRRRSGEARRELRNRTRRQAVVGARAPAGPGFQRCIQRVPGLQPVLGREMGPEQLRCLRGPSP